MCNPAQSFISVHTSRCFPMPSNGSHETSSSMKSGIIEAMSQFRSFPLDASRLLWLWFLVGGMVWNGMVRMC